MLRLFFQFVALLIILLQTGCVTLPPSTQYQPITWSQRQAQLSAIHSWNLNSAVSVQQNNHVNIANLTWQQQGNQFQQTVSGPLNIGGIRITGTPGRVTLIRSSQQTITASSPEQLMQQELGWQLPVSNLYYWVRGLPVPGIRGQEKFDSAHHLIALNQQGWQIQYSDYRTFQQVDLPTKIILINSQIQAKMVIRHWQLG